MPCHVIISSHHLSLPPSSSHPSQALQALSARLRPYDDAIAAVVRASQRLATAGLLATAGQLTPSDETLKAAMSSLVEKVQGDLKPLDSTSLSPGSYRS